MKKIFRKAMTVIGSAALMGMTMGGALAASYPTPFTSNAAVVYGAGSASTDNIAATNIATALDSMSSSSTTTTVEGGEIFKLEKSSDNFNYYDALNTLYSSGLDDEDMNFLDDGAYDDGDIDEDYTQSITLGSKTLKLFADGDYDDDEPTVGFWFENGETIMTYTIEFDNPITYTDMDGTDMPFLGSNYYVLDASSTQIDILDSAKSETVSEGETVNINGKDVSIYNIDSSGVRFKVDGELVDRIAAGEYEELDDGSYIILKDYFQPTRDVDVGNAEFSIGLGKVELINGSEIEINDEDVDELYLTITDNTGLEALTVTWKSDRDTFVTEESVATMPGFEALKLIFGGLEFPEDSETISFDSGETLTLNMDNFDLPVMWYNDTDAFLGEQDHELIVATSIATNTTWTHPARLTNLTGGLDLEEGDRFIVTDVGTDLGDVETMYYEVDTVENASGDIEVILEDLIGDRDITFDELEAKDGPGSMVVTLAGVNGTISERAYLTFTGGDTIYYNRVVSDKGLVIDLDTDVSDVDTDTAATITLIEADKDDDITEGTRFTVSAKATSNNKLHVSTHNLTAYDEEESDDKYIGYVPSDLASKIMFDTSGDEYEFSLEYYGSEVVADVKVVAGGEVSTTTETDVQTFTDSEAMSMTSKNLVVVGGSAINSIAAKLLGSTYHGEEFTAVTDVAAGEFLIQSFAWGSGKTALLVAGYNAEDTTKASTALMASEDLDVSVGKKYVSSTDTVSETNLVAA